MIEYHGMQWFKCDFQVQTPEDAKHWADVDTRLLEPRTELDLQEKARTYLRRCHQVGLQVIGVTDHNFSARAEMRNWFLTHLIEQNGTVAEELGVSPLHIFPGFEIDIGYHLLCLFEPVKKGADLVRINDVLTTLGLAPTTRFDSGLPAKLRHDNALVALRTVLNKVQNEAHGIVIAAHAFSNSGICDDSVNIGDFCLPELQCVEVTSFPLKSKAKQILEGTDQNWRRTGRQPAYIMSSDAKSLMADKEGNPIPNSLGYRSSWLKMSTPSVESLRQAFLDLASRIRFDDMCPSNGEIQPRIINIAVKGAAFLEDQEICFSPNLNCVIGGRGSGKSSLLEYLRFALEAEADESLPDDIKQKHAGLQDTLEGANSELRITFESAPGVTDTAIFKPSTRTHSIQGREVVNLKTVLDLLQIQFFSQGELSRLTKPGQNHVLRLVDAACGEELLASVNRERELKSELEQLAQVGHRAVTIETEVSRVTQEISELSRQWQARKEIQGEALLHQKAKHALKFMKGALDGVKENANEVVELAERIGALELTLPPDAVEWPKDAWFKQVEVGIAAARKQLQEALQHASNEFLVSLKGVVGDESEWSMVKVELDAAEERFLNACHEKGLQPNEVSRLQEVDLQRQAKQVDLESKQKQLVLLKSQTATRPDKLAALHTLWREQFEARTRACSTIQGRSNGISMEVLYMRDAASFKANWTRLSPKDSRTRLGKNWDEIGSALFGSHLANPMVNSPWEIIEKHRIGADDTKVDDIMLLTHMPDLLKYLYSEDVRANWENVRLSRVDDYVDVELQRPDGTSAGKMSGAGGKLLSEGQRNTALLSILLAQGKGPIVIDQPEDELDSNYIYTDLVPLLRDVKSSRQMILATHNANLPVNADAELIYAVEARDGHGGKLAVGGLDRTDVTLAVLNIMEGSEQAFRRRGEKYNF